MLKLSFVFFVAIDCFQVSVRKPYFFEDKSEVVTVDTLEQKYALCPAAVKDAYLVYVVKNFHEKRPKSSVLIFSHTCRECQALAVMFNGLGFRVRELSIYDIWEHMFQPENMGPKIEMPGAAFSCDLFLYCSQNYLQVGSLHSMISQQERLSSLTNFRSGRIRILICTDVAARGLDIPHVRRGNQESRTYNHVNGGSVHYRLSHAAL